MNVRKMTVTAGIAAALLMMIGVSQTSAATIDVPMGSLCNFAILGGSGVTNTGSSVINGDVGSAPTPAVTGFYPAGIVNGTLYTAAGTETTQAHTDLIAAYNAAAGALGGVAGPADLGGALLTPGVYTYSSAATWTAGNLTLDGQSDPNAQWIFQIGSTLITPGGADVSLINGALANNVFWQVGSSATIGGTNNFSGNILAQESISLGGGTLEGRAMAINGAVTISAAETINAPECDINGNGGDNGNGDINPVPEPVSASLALMGVGALALTLRRRRRVEV